MTPRQAPFGTERNGVITLSAKTVLRRGSERGEPTAPLMAMRAELGMVAVLLAAAGLAWWFTAEQMAGMDAGPGTNLGALGWFTGVWAVMMAAMMLPSLAPTAAVHAALMRREPSRVLLFTGGYLLVWSAAGVVAYALFELGKSLSANALAWDSGGRWLAAGVLVLAALYQLTPFKRAFLTRCRSPLRFLRDTLRDSRSGAFAMGLRSGGWCVGCSWALMAALFALGVMSLTWMVLIAGLVALEKVGPWGRAARVATAGVLVVLAVAILAVPHEVPGFVVPGSHGSMHAMKAMGMSS
jgi:predicted metal-binding membrane protein